MPCSPFGITLKYLPTYPSLLWIAHIGHQQL